MQNRDWIPAKAGMTTDAAEGVAVSQLRSAESVVQELDEHVTACQKDSFRDEVHRRRVDCALGDEITGDDDCVSRMSVIDQLCKTTWNAGLAEVGVLHLDGQDTVTARQDEVYLIGGPPGAPVVQFIRHRQDLEELLKHDLFDDMTAVSAVWGQLVNRRSVVHTPDQE
jgi:hypothetical protein